MEGFGSMRKDPLIEKKIATSGWCLTHHHSRCEEFYFGKWKDHDCNCKCHVVGSKEKEEK